MRLAGMPLVEEGLRTYASHRAILRTYLLIPCALAIALLVAWPQVTAGDVFRGAIATDPFSVVGVTLLVFLLYLGGRYGEEDFSPDTLGNLREYVTLTPASVAALVAGKAVFGILHTIFLLALGVPFLLAAYSVSGAPAGSLGSALAVLASATFAARMYGLLLLAALGQRRLLRSAALIGSIGGFLLGSYLLLPAVNPIAALLRGTGESVARETALLVLLNFAVSLLFTAAVTVVLLRARHAARRAARIGSGPEGDRRG